jgi:hypothetical protein
MIGVTDAIDPRVEPRQRTAVDRKLTIPPDYPPLDDRIRA